MPFVPEFAKNPRAYLAEKAAVRTLPEWKAFSEKWFDTKNWPRQTPDQLAEASARKRGWIELGGRTWSSTSLAYDLSPEDRYEYLSTFHEIGDPLKFPGAEPVEKRSPKNGWRQECPYDEITTAQLGAPLCPHCGRRLVYVQIG